MSYSLTKGIVSAKNRVVSGQEYIQIDAPINSGNSGGPLLNASGEVLGVNTMKLVDSEGIGLAIPTSTVKSYIDGLGLTITDNKIDEGTISSTAPITTEAEGDTGSDRGISIKPSDKAIIAILAIVTTLSVCLNIILIIILAIKRKPKKKKAVSDPRERTNFEIEFLE
jgi:serine protease Do